MNAGGDNQARLTNNNEFDGDPSWSPDGSEIAFSSERGEGHTEIYVMDADGSNQTRLTNYPGSEEGEGSPAWSPFLIPEPSASLSIAASLLTLSWLRARRKKLLG